MTDWATTASLATASGTMILAIATFGSTRSANRAARTAERAMLAGIRPLLLTSRLQDPGEKVMWSDEHFAKLPGGQATIEPIDGVVYMACALRNVGAGIDHALAALEVAVEQVDGDAVVVADPGRDRQAQRVVGLAQRGVPVPGVAGGDVDVAALAAELVERGHGPVGVETDGDVPAAEHVTRVGLTWRNDVWITGTSRHWNLDRDDPR